MESEILDLLWAKSPERLVEGRTPYPLLAHLLDTSVTAGAVWDLWLPQRLRGLLTRALAPGDPARARSIVRATAALHDFGKSNPVFQLQLANPRKLSWRSRQRSLLASCGLSTGVGFGPFLQTDRERSAPLRRHEHVAAFSLLQAPVESASPTHPDYWLALIAGGHHGQWLATGGDGSECEAFLEAACDDGWAETHTSLIDMVLRAHGLPRDFLLQLSSTTAPTPTVVMMLLTGITIVADWLASDDATVAAGEKLLPDTPLDPVDWLQRRQNLRTRVVDLLGRYNPLADPVASVLQGYEPRPLQRSAIDLGDAGGLWVCSYPTGEGKTEAALLRHCAVDEGLIFALPTMATTDAMHGRLTKVFGDSNVVRLFHQFSAVLPPQPHLQLCESHPNTSPWYTDSIRRLLSPVAAMTCDQVLVGGLHNKFIAVRLLGLAAHHVVLDEVHTYDLYQTQLLRQLLCWWGATGTRVTLLSATLPAWQEAQFVGAYRAGADCLALEQSYPRSDPKYPSHRLVDPQTGHDEHHSPGLSGPEEPLDFKLVDTDDVRTAHVDWVLQMRSEAPNAHLAVVVNTVDDAIAIAQALRGGLGDAELRCLHSRMTREHRTSIEQYITARLGKDAEPGKPLVVVATQVIEASLDLDFDYLSTSLCPAPSLVQRAGRVHRFRDSAARIVRLGFRPDRKMLRVVASEGLRARACLPYFSSELERVRSYIADHPTIQVPDDVQPFVDTTAFDLTAFWDLAKAQDGLQEELADAVNRIRDAGSSQARIDETLTAVPKGRRAWHYQRLVDLSKRDVAEELLRTRYIDSPTATYTLVAGDLGQAAHAWPGTAAQLCETPQTDASGALRYAIPLSDGARRRLAVGAEPYGPEGPDWMPEAGLIRGLPPLDLALIKASGVATYDELTGLTPVDPPTEGEG